MMRSPSRRPWAFHDFSCNLNDLSVQCERLSVLAAYDVFGRRNPYFLMR